MAISSKERPAKVAKRESTKGPNWLELPIELTTKILHMLGPFEILNSASFVCPLWWKICMDPLMWRTIGMTNHPPYSHHKLVRFCRLAIKRGWGHLEDIRIDGFATDDLLKYIAASKSPLRRLQFPNSRSISVRNVLRKVLKKLPLLEELDISYVSIDEDSFEAIGQCCPLLKTLKYHMGLVNDEGAFVLAKNMPELRHLAIGGNCLTNKGLIAILDGCPHLQSLDLRGCFNVDLSGSLGKKCREQIKNLQEVGKA